MTLQIREATPADAMLHNALAYRIYRAHFEQKAPIFEHPAFEQFFAFLFSHSSYFSCCPQMREIIVFTYRLSR
ncbi:hypothetical protein [Citrobacter portucalensis]|uniref:Uncharacterized protein n=1 Tax=Citrobacter portucalensis TaxID=1639133 RepID=A0A9X4JP20_9ENTR|nr:hypothetical protein [Citrobacter portucalensis]MDE9620268.1 hypothetical protein [Citrobacter portucalensis]